MTEPVVHDPGSVAPRAPTLTAGGTSSGRVARAARWTKLLGYVLAVPAFVYIVAVGSSAADPDAAADTIGRLFTWPIIVFVALWLVLRYRTRYRIGHYWPWIIVVVALAVFALRLLPAAETSRRSVDTYVGARDGYASEQAA